MFVERDEFIDELIKLATTDPSIMLITGDLGFGVLLILPSVSNQFINAGVVEQNMTALACGLALEGHKVYTYSIGNFATYVVWSKFEMMFVTMIVMSPLSVAAAFLMDN